MLTMPYASSSIVSLIGIDPGSDTLGVGILNLDITTLNIVSSQAFTLHGLQNARGSWTTEIHGDRQGRIESHRERLLQLFQSVQPLDIACESPFINRRRPNAYGALTEVVSAVRRAVMQFDIWKQLVMIDPPTVKKAVGVSGKTGGPDGKKLMQRAVLAMPEFCYNGHIPIELLDEHSIDALAVAYARYTMMLEELCLR